jgi:trans-aconitate methyltransferase
MPDPGPVPAADHWVGVYASRDGQELTWFQPHAQTSLRLIEQLELAHDARILDVGGGASTLVDDLLERGFGDLTILDVSANALQVARARLGGARDVHWLERDLLTWQPERTYQLWHDRAVLHFLTAEEDRQRYVAALRSATAVGSAVVFGVFAADGPTSCSGLPVRR